MDISYIIYAQGQQRRFSGVLDLAAAVLLLGVLQAFFVPYSKQYIERTRLIENLVTAGNERMLNVVEFSLNGRMVDEFALPGSDGFDISETKPERPILPDYINGGVSQRQELYHLKVSGTIPRAEIPSASPTFPVIRDRGVDASAAASQVYRDISQNTFHTKRRDLIDQSVDSTTGTPDSERNHFVSGGSIVFLANQILDNANRPLIFELTVQNNDQSKFNSIWYDCGTGGLSTRGGNATSPEIVEIESLCRASGIN